MSDDPILAALKRLEDGQRKGEESQTKFHASVNFGFDRLSTEQAKNRSEIMARIDRLQGCHDPSARGADR